MWDRGVVANVDIARFCPFIVLVTNWVVVRSSGLSTAKLRVFSARVFSDMSQEAHIHNIIEFLGQTGAGVGTGWGEDGSRDGDEALIRQ